MRPVPLIFRQTAVTGRVQKYLNPNFVTVISGAEWSMEHRTCALVYCFSSTLY